MFEQLNPHPQTELMYTNTYTLLVAVSLSAQSTDKSVNIATKELFKIVDTPEKMLALGLENLKSYIQSIGLYHTKAKHLIEAAHILATQHKGTIPQTQEELIKLPGVGRKTAHVVRSIAFNEPCIAVDTHIFRVSNRIGLAQGRTPLAIEKGLEKVIPQHFLSRAHHWLILHGRYICKAKSPKCEECKISLFCEYYKKNYNTSTI